MVEQPAAELRSAAVSETDDEMRQNVFGVDVQDEFVEVEVLRLDGACGGHLASKTIARKKNSNALIDEVWVARSV